MTPVALVAVVVAGLLVLLVIGVPVAFALGLTAIAVLIWQWGLGAIDLVGDTLLSALEDFTLVAVPLFILMGVAASLSNAGSDMRELVKRWLHKIPGGLIIANICAGALFSGLSSTGAATCLAVGREGLPELLERRYDPGVAGGAIAAAGTLGILIPPSLTMIVYGLAGGVWSADPEHAKRIARRLRTGQVEINGGNFNLLAPFGGYKQSGRGREYGKYGIEEFLEVKSMQL